MTAHQVASARTPFLRFTDFVGAEIGVKLGETKRQMIESRLRRRCMALGLSTLDEYLIHLFDKGGLDSERDEIFDAVTTNKTDFYREPDHFRVLAQQGVPAFLQRRRPVFKVWSAAASTGAECWTTAFVLSDLARQEEFRWAILGTDINIKVLERARRAVYTTNEVAPVPRSVSQRYLLEGRGTQAGNWRVHSRLRQNVAFRRLNLMDPSYPLDKDFDAIFLRNVLIYFEPAVQAAVIDRLSRHLVTGGLLFVGHSESMVVRSPKFRQISPACFEKVLQ